MKLDYTLYLVTGCAGIQAPSLCSAVEQAILGGCTMVQLREERLPSRELYARALALKQITDQYHIPLIVNDWVDIALAIGAAGVHLGQRDLPAAAARSILRPGMLLGVSVTSVQEALAAQCAGADYSGIGAMFPTQTKPDAPIVSREELGRIRQAVPLPLVAIGGICAENAASFRGAVDGLAVSSAILCQRHIQQAAASIRAHFCGVAL